MHYWRKKYNKKQKFVKIRFRAAYLFKMKNKDYWKNENAFEKKKDFFF